MRNLKKVLSLVLALAMVLSICMAGASAVDYDNFTDKESITKEEAVATLVNLDVINGYNDGAEFRPAGNVTRAEMVTMICRVLAGGDNMIPNAVKEVPTYNDVRNNPSAAWAETYIEYCTSLGIVSGKGNGIFDPMADVTAAEAAKIVMTAVGYNADIEGFKGIGWDINTMAKASTLKLTENLVGEISANQPVTREQVAQLIYNAMSIPMVQNYNGNMANLWIGSGANAYQQTLLEKAFNAKKVTGAVIANEWASLLDDRPIDKGKTMLWLLDDEGDIAYEGDWDKLISTKEFQNDVLTVNASTTLEQIGSSVTVLYKTDTRQNIFGIVMDSGLNNYVEFKEGGKLETRDMSFDTYSKDRQSQEWVKKGNYGTQYFINYDDQAALETVSDYRIRYVVYTTTAQGWATSNDQNFQDMKDEGTETINGATYYVYSKTITPGNTFSRFDLNTIRDIFYNADRVATSENPTEDQIAGGEVYVATQSKEDISDELSWKEFQREYLTSTEYGHAYFDTIENGNYAKLVDCDNDGVAEFAFKIMYNMAEVTRATERNGEANYTYYDAGSAENPETDLNNRQLVERTVYSDDFAAEDIIVYTIIDGIAYVDPADVVTATVNKVSYRNESITTADGDEYSQSGIKNETGYAEDILAIDEKVQYNLYLDKYGYVRIYKLVDGQTVYGLLTEAYITRDFNSKYVTDYVPHVELKAGGERIAEYVVSNWTVNGGNEFFNSDHHHVSANGIHSWDAEQDSLVRAAYHLNMATNDSETRTVGLPGARRFIYDNSDKTGGTANDFSVTNVARYTLNDDGTVSISPATKYATTKSGEAVYYTNREHTDKTWRSKYLAEGGTETGWNTFLSSGYTGNQPADRVFSVDYIRLDQAAVTAKQRSFPSTEAGEGNYGYNRYVSAVHDTEFYLVQANTVTYFTDYANLPAISKDKISAIYAVAENTASDVKGDDYWVANVIVIELEDWDVDFDSISLAYYNSSKTTSRVRDIDSLNSKTSTPKTTMVPLKESDWAGQWKSFGFYKTYNAKEDGAELTAERIELVYNPNEPATAANSTRNYNKAGIYAGTVDRTSEVDPRGGYITVYMQGTNAATYDKTKTVDVINVPIYAIGSSTQGGYVRANVTDLEHVRTGDRIIWVESDNKVAFAVVSGYDGQPGEWNAPSWLFADTNSQWAYIMEGQAAVSTGGDTPELWFYGVKATLTGKTFSATVSYKEASQHTDEDTRFDLRNGEVVLSNTSDKAPAPVPAATGTAPNYTGTILGDDGVYYQYNLTQSLAGSTGTLSDYGQTEPEALNPSDTTATAPNEPKFKLPDNDTPWRVTEFVQRYRPTDPNASADYMFTLFSGGSITVSYRGHNEAGTEWDFGSADTGLLTSAVGRLVINVYPENGGVATQYVLVNGEAGAALPDYTGDLTALVDSLADRLEYTDAGVETNAILSMPGVGDAVTAAYAALDEAETAAEMTAAFENAKAEILAAVKEALNAEVYAIMGGYIDADGNQQFNNWCVNTHARYDTYLTAMADAGTVEEAKTAFETNVKSIMRHLDYVLANGGFGVHGSSGDDDDVTCTHPTHPGYVAP